jgi:WD40 repeat protein
MPLATGTKLDVYELLGLLGAGGMGEVYRARDSALRREVAIKVLPAFVSQDPDRLRRFEQEAQAAAALNHPNILAVHRFGVFEDAPYLVAELLEGSTLREMLRHGALPPRKAADYGVQIAHGLAAAHDKGIVHRDLKPENLFVTKDGRIKILDFGLARLSPRLSDPDGNMPTQTVGTDPGVVMGTVGYMSPEQVRGKPIDHRVDIFAFGAILYEMLSGRRAFQRSTPAETMTAILQDEPPGISQIVQTAPGLQRVVHRCLEKSPEQRFQSASDLAFALEALSESGSGPAVVVDRRSRLRWIWAAVGGVTLTLIAALILWWRIPPAIPVVESVTQLTDDGQPKRWWMFSDGSRIYFNEGAAKVAQVSVNGGAAAPVETRFPLAYLTGITQDGSALLVAAPEDQVRSLAPLWSIPLPAGEPRRLGDIVAFNADMFPDGRVVFGRLSPRTGGTGTDSQTDWFIADKGGLNPQKLVSVPGNFGAVSVSQDGKEIVIVSRLREGDRRLFQVAADGTGLREIRRLREGEQNFRWTADGKYLAYQSGTDTQSDLWLLPMPTGILRRTRDPIRLTNGPLPYSRPCPSRDGKQIFAFGTKARGELVRYDLKSKQFVPFLSGISATDPTFSRDGRWVAYASYPDHALWRSRSDGSERMQLTYAYSIFPFISPDGTKVAFHTPKNELFVVSMEGGTPQKLADNAIYASWSPDGNYLFDENTSSQLQITDVRTGKNSSIPSFSGIHTGFWLTQDILVAPDEKRTNLVTFNLKTRQLNILAQNVSGGIEHWMISPDAKYFCFTTGGTEPKAMRVRIADHQLETITSLKGFYPILNFGNTQINVAPDGSPIFTRDKSYEEIYALNVRWP